MCTTAGTKLEVLTIRTFSYTRYPVKCNYAGLVKMSLNANNCSHEVEESDNFESIGICKQLYIFAKKGKTNCYGRSEKK